MHDVLPIEERRSGNAVHYVQEWSAASLNAGPERFEQVLWCSLSGRLATRDVLPQVPQQRMGWDLAWLGAQVRMSLQAHEVIFDDGW